MKWLSRISLFFAILASVFFFSKYGEDNDIFYGDALGYYSYLPSAFCLHNLDSIDKFPQPNTISSGIDNYFQMYRNNGEVTPKGYYINQYTCGVAIFEMPFFLVAHAYTRLNGLESTGYTLPYHTAVMVSSLFYMLLGLFFCFKILRTFYNRDLSIFAVSIMLLASNLFWFTALQLGMVHNILFFLVALLIYCTIQFYKNRSTKWLYVICLVLGFIMLLRPTDIIFGLIPLLYTVDSMSALKGRLQFLLSLKFKLLLAVAIFVLPLLPQMIFWKYYTGSFIYYSYNGQSFHFLQPKIWEGLFGPDNGWLLYSPIWVLALFAFFRKHTFFGFKTAIILLLPLYIYIIYSWECYQYINGFGSRPMLHIYPLLLIPLAVFLEWVIKKSWIGVIAVFVISLFVYHNIHFTYLNETGKYWSQFSNYGFFKRVFFKNNLSYNDLVYKDISVEQPNEILLEKVGESILYNSLDDDIYPSVFDNKLGDSVLHIPEGEESPKINLGLPLQFAKPYFPNVYVKLSCVVKFPGFLGDPYASLVMVHKFTNVNEDLTWSGLNVFSKMGLPNDRYLALDSIKVFNGAKNLWDTVSVFFPIETETDSLTSKVDFWNTAKTEFYLHSVQIEVFKKK